MPLPRALWAWPLHARSPVLLAYCTHAARGARHSDTVVGLGQRLAAAYECLDVDEDGVEVLGGVRCCAEAVPSTGYTGPASAAAAASPCEAQQLTTFRRSAPSGAMRSSKKPTTSASCS